MNIKYFNAFRSLLFFGEFVGVEGNKGLVTDVGQLTTKGYVAPGRIDDESGVATSWVDVVRKKRPYGPSRLVGNQSVAMLTLFTKPKVVN